MPRTRKLKQSQRPLVKRLQSLIEASKLLNSTFDLDELLALILNLATRNLNAERGTIYLIDEEKGELWSKVLKGNNLVEIRLPLGKGIAGHVAATGKTINLTNAKKNKWFFGGFDEQSGFVTKTMLCMPMKNREGTIIGVFQIINKRKGTFTAVDAQFLNAFSDHASIAIINARLYHANLENERVTKELQIAARIQQQMLPSSLPSIDGYEIAATTIPCKTIGGDMYDVIQIAEHQYLFHVADVSGKGIPASLLVSTLNASLEAYLESHMPLDALVQRLNMVVLKNAPSDHFITLCLFVLDTATHTLQYVNAGHNSPYIFTPTTKTFSALCASGIPLGMMEGMTYELVSTSLHAGETLIAYTDGVTEAMNKRKQMFGDDRLKKTVERMYQKRAEEILNAVLEEVQRFEAGEPSADDVTMLVVKRL